MSIEEHFRPRFGERRRRLLRLVFDEDFTISEAAREVGVSYKVARNWVNVAREDGGYDESPKSSVPIDDAVLRYQWDSDAPLKRIAERLGVSTWSVRARARALGLPKRGRRIDDERLKQLWSDSALTVWQIAAKLGGFDKSTVRLRARELGLPQRAQRRPSADHPFRSRVVTHRG